MGWHENKLGACVVFACVPQPTRYLVPVSISTSPAALMIFSFSTEGTIALCDKWNDRDVLTLSELHDALRESCTDASRRDCDKVCRGCNKVHGVLAYTDANGDEQEHTFRIDANAHTIGKTLTDHFDGWVAFYSTKRGETYASQYGKRPASEAAAHFASLAAIVRATA